MSNLYSQAIMLAKRKDAYLDRIDDTFRTVMQLVESPDPFGQQVARAKSLLTEVQGLCDRLQVTEHELCWANEKLDIIDRCTSSDRLQ